MDGIWSPDDNDPIYKKQWLRLVVRLLHLMSTGPASKYHACGDLLWECRHESLCQYLLSLSQETSDITGSLMWSLVPWGEYIL
jgi:hypothetical protein